MDFMLGSSNDIIIPPSRECDATRDAHLSFRRRLENESIPSRDRTACFVDLHTDRNFIDELIRRAGVIMSHEEKRVWSRH